LWLASHLGLLLQAPTLLPQIWLALLKVQAPSIPGALQQTPPSQVSPDSTIPLPQNLVTGGVPEGDGSTEIEAVPETEKDIDPVEVKEGVRELERVVDKDPVPDIVLVPVGVWVKVVVPVMVWVMVMVMLMETVPEKLVETDEDKLLETELETELDTLLEIELETLLEIEVETVTEVEPETEGDPETLGDGETV